MNNSIINNSVIETLITKAINDGLTVDRDLALDTVTIKFNNGNTLYFVHSDYDEEILEVSSIIDGKYHVLARHSLVKERNRISDRNANRYLDTVEVNYLGGAIINGYDQVSIMKELRDEGYFLKHITNGFAVNNEVSVRNIDNMIVVHGRYLDVYLSQHENLVRAREVIDAVVEAVNNSTAQVADSMSSKSVWNNELLVEFFCSKDYFVSKGIEELDMFIVSFENRKLICQRAADDMVVSLLKDDGSAIVVIKCPLNKFYWEHLVEINTALVCGFIIK